MRGRRLRPAADTHGMSLTTHFSVRAVKDQRLKIHTCCAAAQVMQAQGGSQQCHQAVSAWGLSTIAVPRGDGTGTRSWHRHRVAPHPKVPGGRCHGLAPWHRATTRAAPALSRPPCHTRPARWPQYLKLPPPSCRDHGIFPDSQQRPLRL